MHFADQKYKLWTLCFSWYKNRKLKVQLWWVGARERKKRAFFVPFNFSEENFLKICVSSQCTAYWISFQNIHSFTYQNTLLHPLSLLVSKIAESIRCILNINIPDLFLPLLWRLGPSSKSFDDFHKITIKCDLLIFSHDVYYFWLSHCTPLTL